MGRRPAFWLLVLAVGIGFWRTPAAAGQLPRLTRQQVETVLRLGKNLALRDLSGLDLTGLNFSSANLREANLSGANLEGVNLRGANLRMAVLVRANLRGVELDGADFGEADLTQAVLSGARGVLSSWMMALIRDARLDGANLERAQMLGTRLEGSDLSRANLSGGSYIRARFSGTNLASARLDRGTFTHASFENANLTGASFRFARLIAADFSGADIAGANFVSAEVTEALNLDSAKNAETAIWQDRPVSVASAQSLPAGKTTARIIPRNGDVIDVESFEEHGELFSYIRAGSTYGIPKGNVRRIEDASGRVLREFVDRIPAVAVRDCSRPKVGDHAAYMNNYVKCLDKYKMRANFSQGISARASGEQAGQVTDPAVRGVLLRRWEIRDEHGRLIETYEALGPEASAVITLVSE